MKIDRHFIYALKCASDRFYIGRTMRNPQVRLHEHQKGRGAVWTQLYRPTGFYHGYPRKMKSGHDENNTTLEFMSKYGIDRVRGGSFCELNLPLHKKQVIQTMIDNFHHRCFACHMPFAGRHWCKTKMGDRHTATVTVARTSEQPVWCLDSPRDSTRILENEDDDRDIGIVDDELYHIDHKEN